MTAAEVQALRRARGWTQVEMARRLRVSRLSIWRWESGAVTPLKEHRDKMRRWARESARKGER